MRTLTKFIAALLVALPAVLLSQSGSIPTPASVLGFEPGADLHLATYDQSISYFKKLAASSKYLQLAEAGKTTQGRTYYYALISSPSNLSKIDRYREIARRIAHPDGLTDDQARQLARDGKAIIHIDGGLHATESAGPQHTPLLAYDILRRANEPDMKAALDNVILMLWPTINPDGQQMVAEWEMKNVGAAGGGGGLPQLYQEYVGHDNNRDAYMLDMIESRVVEHVWRQWEPQIIHVHHQGAPAPSRIWFPPFAEPIAPFAPFLMSREVNMIGMAMAKAEDEAGKVGTTHMGTGYDAWYPGYIDYNPMFKNIVAYWTETAASSISPAGGGGGGGGGGRGGGQVQRPQSLYSSPWPGGPWRMRDAVEYMEVASLAVVEFASKYKESILFDRYLAGRDQIARGRQEAPYAYVIPQDQRDPVAAVELLRRLAFSGVRVSQLAAPVAMGETIYPPGTWVVPTDQEFAAVLREVLDVQKYPSIRGTDGQMDTPYDAAGWTLPMQMGVTVDTISKPLSTEARASMRLLGPVPDPKLKPTPYNLATIDDASPFDSVPGIGFDTNPGAAAIVPRAGSISGAGPSLVLSPAQNNTFRALNRAWKAGLEVAFVQSDPGGGRYVINGLSEKDQNDLVMSLALTAERLNVSAEPVKRPRIALLNAPNSMDEGWTRWVLDQYGFQYLRITAQELQAGSLRDKIDVLILADDGRVSEGGGRGGRGGGGAGAGGGRGAGAAPPAGAPPAAPPVDLRTKAIDEFVRAGGTLVCFDHSSTSAIDQLKLPVKNATAGLSRQEFFVGGSLLQVTTDPSQRVMAGMPEKAAVYFDSGPAFETLPDFQGAVLARYEETSSPLLSGFLLGEKYLQGKAAALDVQLGQGHVILLGFRPQWRGQPFGTFRVIFNAAVYAR
jgi:hypothetical protein